MKINLYDFDGTIYNGDSSIDFYKFCFKKKKSICKYWIKIGWCLFLYVLGIKTKTETKQVFFCFLKNFDNIDELVEEFWKINFCKIKKWYLKKNHNNDIIISASPEFLLKTPCKKLKVFDLIASNVSKKNGKFLSENCYGLKKVDYLNSKYPDIQVIEMYTDSLSDKPLLDLSINGYIVDNEKIVNYKDYNLSFKKKIKKTFFDPQFIRFLIVGGINVINGVLFAYLYSLIINNAIMAFIVGYMTSLIVSYLLNSFITFKDFKLKFLKFIKFCVSYIPNFLIQLMFVFIFVKILGLYKLIAYIFSAIIGVPITYLILLLFTFRKEKDYAKKNY